jgi:hypothetical protein
MEVVENAEREKKDKAQEWWKGWKRKWFNWGYTVRIFLKTEGWGGRKRPILGKRNGRF